MYHDILLPVAPAGEANDAIPHAASLAERYGATVHVVSAIDTLSRTLLGAQAGPFAERIESAAQERVEMVTAELEAEGVTAIGSVRQGEPVDVIENAIVDTGADIVVMPSHTRTGLRRVLLGSVTEKVIRISPVPVVTVPMADPEEADAGARADANDDESTGGGA